MSTVFLFETTIHIPYDDVGFVIIIHLLLYVFNREQLKIHSVWQFFTHHTLSFWLNSFSSASRIGNSHQKPAENVNNKVILTIE